MLYPRRPFLAQVLLPLSFYFKLNFTTNQKKTIPCGAVALGGRMFV